MFFINKDKVDEDVEKIRRYTMSPEKLNEIVAAEEADKKHHDEVVSEFTAKDIIAMSIAVFEIIIPYVLIIFGAMIAVFLLFYLMSTL